MKINCNNQAHKLQPNSDFSVRYSSKLNWLNTVEDYPLHHTCKSKMTPSLRINVSSLASRNHQEYNICAKQRLHNVLNM